MPRFPLPPIAESTEELLEMRRHERDERRRERLHLLWLLASGAVSERQSAARQLGRNRETISRWLKDYAQGGLAALLRAPQRPGPPSQGGIGLPEQTKAAIRERLAQPRGERGYLALWRRARTKHALSYSCSHFHRWVHGQLGASLKVARKSHGQKKSKNSPPSARRA
jgi:transposase